MNPFYVTGTIPDHYFCDRNNETDWIIKTIENKKHILLTSPRRMGKTQLIRHVFAHPKIRDNYYTFYSDIFATTTLHELVLFLSKEIYSVLVPKGRIILDKFVSILRSLAGSFGYDPILGIPTFDIKLGDIHSPELTLEEIFNYLEQAELPCIFAIDEFQQIAYYPENNVEALLRTYIQKMNNCLFIYAGSDRHILENMFYSAAKPFYNSAEQMYLDRIEKDVYVDFIKKQFKDAKLVITDDAACLAYELFDGHTYYVHTLLHDVFADATKDTDVTTSVIETTLNDIIIRKSRTFSSIMNQLNYQQKETLVAIAKEGKAQGVTSAAFVKRHALKSPSSVQYAIATLLDRQLITYQNEGRAKVYSVSDRFFNKWIVRTY